MAQQMVEVVVNVTIDNVHWVPGLNFYVGKFTYQQVSPLSPIIVNKQGDINLGKAKISDPVEVTYQLTSTQVEIDGELYPVAYDGDHGDSFWVIDGKGKPGKKAKLPNHGEIDVLAGGGNDRLIMQDANLPSKFYTYALALRVGIDGGQWLVDDPIIINKGTTRLSDL